MLGNLVSAFARHKPSILAPLIAKLHMVSRGVLSRTQSAWFRAVGRPPDLALHVASPISIVCRAASVPDCSYADGAVQAAAKVAEAAKSAQDAVQPGHSQVGEVCHPLRATTSNVRTLSCADGTSTTLVVAATKRS